MMEIYGLTSKTFGVNTWLIEENRHCILIDPVLTTELETRLSTVAIDFAILTHEHFDHICGVNELRDKYQTRIYCGEKAKDILNDPRRNLARYSEYISLALPFGDGSAVSMDYRCTADRTVANGETFEWQGHELLFRETPGHSVGGICILLDKKFLFCGDSLFRDYPTATRMPGGDSKQYAAITKPWFASLPQEISVYPGHGTVFALSERYENNK